MKALLFAIAAVVVGLALFEVTMQPTAAERTELSARVRALVGALDRARRPADSSPRSSYGFLTGDSATFKRHCIE